MSSGSCTEGLDRVVRSEPDSRKRDLLKMSDMSTLTKALSLSKLTQPENASSFEIPPNRAPKLPRDHARHYEVQSDWHFFVAHLQDQESGERHAALLLLKGFSLAGPKHLRKDQLKDNSIELAQLNVTSKDGFVGGPEVLVPGSETTSLGRPFVMKHSEKYYMKSTGSDIFPMKVYANAPGACLDVTVTSKKEMFPQGENGFFGLSGAIGWGYYSYTNLLVSGTLKIGSKVLKVGGKGWFDHQWGTIGRMGSPLYRTLNYVSSVISKPKSMSGWNWFAIQLDNDVEFTTAYGNFWDKNGNVVVQDDNKPWYGKYSFADGTSKYVSSGVKIKVLRRTTSPHTGGSYPIEWEISEESQNLKVKMVAYTDDQFALRTDGTEYAENATTVSGTMGSRQVTGVGWGENVGFTSESRVLKSRMMAAGLPINSTAIKAISDAPGRTNRSRGLKGLAIAVVILMVLIYVKKCKKKSK